MTSLPPVDTKDSRMVDSEDEEFVDPIPTSVRPFMFEPKYSVEEKQQLALLVDDSVGKPVKTENEKVPDMSEW